MILGRHRLDGMGVNEAARGAEKIVNHPYYDRDTFDNDIALVRLSMPVQMNDYISTICLASKDSVIHPGTYTWVTGWGTTSNGTILVSNKVYFIPKQCRQLQLFPRRLVVVPPASLLISPHI